MSDATATVVLVVATVAIFAMLFGLATYCFLKWLEHQRLALARTDEMQVLRRQFTELDTATKAAIVNQSKTWRAELDALKSPSQLAGGMMGRGR